MRAAPYAEPLTGLEGEFEARFNDGTRGADRERCPLIDSSLGKEQFGVGVATGRIGRPRAFVEDRRLERRKIKRARHVNPFFDHYGGLTLRTFPAVPESPPWLIWLPYTRFRAPGRRYLLYFVYTARIAPDELTEVAPSATFEFVAHLAESTLSFSVEGNGWNGGLPTVVSAPGSTVWGAVFSIPAAEATALDRIERKEARVREEADVVDRNGRRYRAVVHRAAESTGPEFAPAPDYLDRMLTGSRHWELPIGWILRLEDHLNSIP